jgi:hypothetical protein
MSTADLNCIWCNLKRNAQQGQKITNYGKSGERKIGFKNSKDIATIFANVQLFQEMVFPKRFPLDKGTILAIDLI